MLAQGVSRPGAHGASRISHGEGTYCFGLPDDASLATLVAVVLLALARQYGARAAEEGGNPKGTMSVRSRMDALRAVVFVIFLSCDFPFLLVCSLM